MSQADNIYRLLKDLMYAPHKAPNVNDSVDEWLDSLEPLTAEQVDNHVEEIEMEMKWDQ